MQIKDEYLERNVFYGLTNLNTGFDSPSIKYFSAEDFEIILNRVKRLGLGIFGIEPWKDGAFYSVKVYEHYTNDPTEYNWYMSAFISFKNEDENLQYSASYFVPEGLLNKG